MTPKNPGYRMTKQRMVILEELRKQENYHPSADEIYENVRRQLPRISLGTVYRNLEILCEQGEIQKLELGGTLKRFDGIADNHCHIRCICCERVDNAPIDPIVKIDESITMQSDFKVLDHRLYLIGLCHTCMDQNLPNYGISRSQKS